MSNAYRSTLAGGGSAPVGDATAADVLSGKTFSGAVGSGVTGTMTNNGAVSGIATPTTPYTIPEGYHNGQGSVTAAEVKTMTGVGIHVANTGKAVFIPADRIQNNTISLTVDSGPSGSSHAYANTDGSASGGVHVTPIPGTGGTLTFDVSTLTITDGVWLVFGLSSSTEYDMTFE